jgi:hypothetical protein
MLEKPKNKKKKKPKGLSTRNLEKLWCNVIKKKYNNQCIICHRSEKLECHHIVHRRSILLKYDHRNGVPVCSPLTGRNCHNYADSLIGKEIIENMMPYEDFSFIKHSQHIVFKQYMSDNKVSRNEFLQEKKAELLKMMGEL